MTIPHEALAGFPVIITVPVLWGDEDSFGHVNNVIYLKWCETARCEYLQLMKMPAEPTGIGPILARIQCNYRSPVNFPDTVYIGARITRIGNKSLEMEHRIVSKAQNAVVAEADSTIVAVDYDRNVSVTVPDYCREAIREIEGVATL